MNAVPEQGGARTPSGTPDGVRFLVVDDTREVRWLIGILLEEEPGWTVVAEAGDGAEAVVRADEVLPDVVLLDMSMPVMDGLEALPHLRRHLPDALIVLVTAFPVGDVVAVARSRGADACLDKIDMAGSLVPALQDLLGQRRGVRESPAGRSGRLRP